MKHCNINIAYKLSTQPKNQKIYSNLSLLISPSLIFSSASQRCKWFSKLILPKKAVNFII